MYVCMYVCVYVDMYVEKYVCKHIQLYIYKTRTQYAHASPGHPTVPFRSSSRVEIAEGSIWNVSSRWAWAVRVIIDRGTEDVGR